MGMGQTWDRHDRGAPQPCPPNHPPWSQRYRIRGWGVRPYHVCPMSVPCTYHAHAMPTTRLPAETWEFVMERDQFCQATNYGWRTGTTCSGRPVVHQ